MKTATDFTLKDQDGNDFNLFSNLDNYVMLVFYPHDGSLVCTKQLCSYNGELSRFEKLGVKIVGINIEDQSEHKKFSVQNSFNFPLLSDSKKEVSRAYDALNYAKMNKRKVVIVSPSKQIIYDESVFPIFYHQTDQLLKFLKTNKYV